MASHFISRKINVALLVQYIPIKYREIERFMKRSEPIKPLRIWSTKKASLMNRLAFLFLLSVKVCS